mmetsp:Transcript_16459/g.23409  ORF Transcript_16459/g.23409 Transcript_16459/m.23409 type:complete len:188 (-) Transcript_16459:347-910(-)
MMMKGAMSGNMGAVSEPSDDGKMLNLNVKIDKTQCYARNESAQYPMSNLFIGDTRLGCKSDADDQLILHVAFQEFVKVREIKLDEFNRGLHPDLHPSVVKIYVNRSNMGFEDADDIDPTQIINLTAADLKEDAKPISLKFVKFQRVRSITLFVEDSMGGDVSALGGLKFFGRPVATTNMADFKKQEG